MTTITIDSPDWQTCTLTCGAYLTYRHPLVTAVVTDVWAMHLIVPLVKVSVDAAALPFDYRIEAVDGRIWRQKILARDADPPMTFGHNDAWRLSEFTLQRPIRDDVVALLATLDLQSLVLKPA